MSWIATGVIGGLTLGGTSLAVGLSQSARAAKAQKELEANSQGAFGPLMVPEPATIEYMDPEEILGRWRGEVTSQFPEYSKIASKLNEDEQAAAARANQLANPQYYGLLANLSNKALDFSSGRLPDDVRQNVMNQANEQSYLRGFSYGTSGGSNSGGNVYAGGNDAGANLALKNLGLTSLDLTKFGLELTGSALEQSRASRGQIISAKDTIPTQTFFADQLNKQSEGEAMNEQNANNYAAAVANAPQQAAYQQLLFRSNMTANQSAIQGQQMQSILGFASGAFNTLANFGIQSRALSAMNTAPRLGATGAVGGVATGAGNAAASAARTVGSWQPTARSTF